MMKRGFTLIEVIVVVAILGVLGILVIPRLAGQQEVAVLSEGISTLNLYYGAQQRYFIDHNAFTNNCANLDVSITPKNFAAPTCSAAAVAPAADSTLVSIDRNGGSYAYTVQVSRDGVFSCPLCHGDLLRSLPQ